MRVHRRLPVAGVGPCVLVVEHTPRWLFAAAVFPLVRSRNLVGARRSRLRWGTRPGRPGVAVLSALGLLNSALALADLEVWLLGP